MIIENGITDLTSATALTLENRKKIEDELDLLGIESGKAQSLNGPITSLEKLISSNHILLLYYKECILLVYIKYCLPGGKQLYFFSRKGSQVECQPHCLLDFFVSTECQRTGIGLRLFSEMINRTTKQPQQWAFDRPSPKLRAFLEKHYAMLNPDLQPNKYAIYDGFDPRLDM